MKTTAPAPTIELMRLSKRYRGSRVFALSGVSLGVKPGEVYGLLGPNGAGKTTAIRLLLNFIQPTEGGATILGRDIVRESVAVKHHIGYLAGETALYPKMTGRQFLNYTAELQPPKRPNYLRALTRDFQADLTTPIESLSKGNRQKIGLLQALMHEPEILILDEPTSGLDPLMQEVFFSFVASAKARGASVLLSSHNLAEVRRICDRIGFIRAGKLVTEKTIASLVTTASHTFDVTFASAESVDALQKIKGLKITPSHNPKRISIEFKGEITPFFKILAQHRIIQFEQREVDLEKEFMRLYKKSDEPATPDQETKNVARPVQAILTQSAKLNKLRKRIIS